jgi:hypothetical protein
MDTPEDNRPGEVNGTEEARVRSVLSGLRPLDVASERSFRRGSALLSPWTASESSPSPPTNVHHRSIFTGRPTDAV